MTDQSNIPGDRWSLFMQDDGTIGCNMITPTFGGGGVVVMRVSDCPGASADPSLHESANSPVSRSVANLKGGAMDGPETSGERDDALRDFAFALETICARIPPDETRLHGHESTAYQALVKWPEHVKSRHVRQLMGLEAE